jgi:hypothetical protein
MDGDASVKLCIQHFLSPGLSRVNEDNSQNMYFFYKKNMILQEKTID